MGVSPIKINVLGVSTNQNLGFQREDMFISVPISSLSTTKTLNDVNHGDALREASEEWAAHQATKAA